MTFDGNDALRFALAALVAFFAWRLVRRLDEAAAAHEPSAFEDAVRGAAPTKARRPARLEELERIVRMSATSPTDVDKRLRPVLRPIAEHRLRSGARLDDDVTRLATGTEPHEAVPPSRLTELLARLERS